MRKLFVVPFAAVAAIGLAACAESPMETVAPQFELVDHDDRVETSDINAHVYGSFSISFGSSTSAVLGGGVTANFPGNPKNAGTCGKTDGTDAGVWYNPQGKRTSGSEAYPHPHCVGTGAGTPPVSVILEPISVENGNQGMADEFIRFTARDGSGGGFNYSGARLTGSGGKNTNGQGVIVGWAIDASTLNTTKTRVGKITIDLSQYEESQQNLFQATCTLGEQTYSPRCLNKVIRVSYEPYGVNAVGVANMASYNTETAQWEGGYPGFLYWSPASAPFNYVP